MAKAKTSTHLSFFRPDKNRKIFAISDLHGYHKNLCKGTSEWSDTSRCRDFETIEAMNIAVVDSVNSVVGPEDILYAGGDWSFGGIDNISKLRAQINCKYIVCILGNHDHHIRNSYELQSLFVKVSDYEEFYYKKTLFCMSHYPIGSWNGIGKNAINLYGHCHDTYTIELPRQIDVGWDRHKKPISLDWILEYMKNKPVELVDHHDANTNIR